MIDEVNIKNDILLVDIRKFDTSTFTFGGLMVSVLSPSAVDRRFDPQSSQTKDFKIGSSCSSD
jgi:hypothetical protein